MQSLEELSREIESIRQEIREGAAKFATPEAFYEFRKSFLDNKAGKIGHLMKEMRNVPKEDKAAYGKNVTPRHPGQKPADRHLRVHGLRGL